MSWWSVILVEEAGGPGENHRPVARGWCNNNQGVAFMITFLLFIEYVYPVSIEIWNSIQLLYFIEYIQQYFSYVVAVSYIGGGSRRTQRKPPTCRK
jgi:hypothetical protein